jgi:hypothetical protein
MAMARTAKLAGSGAVMLPKEMTSMEEIPWDLSYAIEHAIKVCSWQENLVGDEMPPMWMWPFDDELEIWFDRVDRERKEKYGGGESDTREKVPLMDNELSARFRD